MAFIILMLALLALGIMFAIWVSPFVEKLMRFVWDDPTRETKVKLARRVKELCIDGDIPDETAVLMIAKENGLMEEQVEEMMRSAMADPAIMRMAFGSKVGGILYKGLKKFGAMEG